ncbi:MAG: LacI family DNA-binding transcriptional regulator [Actinophytocola sp.]|uniref:LacI family DNA-binding transcriptional regulator n=1 Tax=Actinophytocola sp. TaxID=1872138 RepID=UPI003D6B057C
MTARRPTISDVARHAGVSKGAVSFALNGRAGVSSETRQRILDAAAELGWSPNHRARALSTSRAFALGLVVARDPELVGADPFFPMFIAGVEKVLAERDQALVLQVVTSPAAEEAGYRRLARDGRVDGVFLVDLREADPRIALLEEIGLPAVTLNRPDVPTPFPAVILDDRPGIAAEVRHLAGLGHTAIAHVSGPEPFLHAIARSQAFADAMAEAGLPPGRVEPGDFTAAGGRAATHRLLTGPDRPTAIVYANDVMALSAIAVAAELGVRIPDDLSITGFDDTDLAGYVHPALTTVRADARGWGEVAARTLLAVIDGEIDEQQVADTALAPAELILRRSTSAP